MRINDRLVPCRRTILEGKLDFDGMLRLACSLAGHLSLEPLLRTAEALVAHAGTVGADMLASCGLA